MSGDAAASRLKVLGTDNPPPRDAALCPQARRGQGPPWGHAGGKGAAGSPVPHPAVLPAHSSRPSSQKDPFSGGHTGGRVTLHDMCK